MKSPNIIGAMLMMASMLAFTLNDTAIKALGDDFPIFQMLVLRSLVTTAAFLLLAWKMKALILCLPLQDWGLIALRSAAEIGAAYFFLTALFNMPIANVTAILQILPLTVTLGGVLFYKEKIGWRRMGAIVLGFFGMLIIVRPGPDGFNLYVSYALAAVGFVTIRDLVTRRMSAETPSLMVTLCSSIALLLFSCAAAFSQPWVHVSSTEGSLIAIASVFIIGAYLFSVMVMRVGDVSFVAPFRYTGLLWALLTGWVFFDEWPDGWTLIGAGIVVGAGVVALSREAQIARQAKRART